MEQGRQFVTAPWLMVEEGEAAPVPAAAPAFPRVRVISARAAVLVEAEPEPAPEEEPVAEAEAEASGEEAFAEDPAPEEAPAEAEAWATEEESAESAAEPEPEMEPDEAPAEEMELPPNEPEETGLPEESTIEEGAIEDISDDAPLSLSEEEAFAEEVPPEETLSEPEVASEDAVPEESAPEAEPATLHEEEPAPAGPRGTSFRQGSEIANLIALQETGFARLRSAQREGMDQLASRLMAALVAQSDAQTRLMARVDRLEAMLLGIADTQAAQGRLLHAIAAPDQPDKVQADLATLRTEFAELRGRVGSAEQIHSQAASAQHELLRLMLAEQIALKQRQETLASRSSVEGLI